MNIRTTIKELNALRDIHPHEWFDHGVDYKSVQVIHSKAVSGQLSDGRRFVFDKETELYTFCK